MNDLKESLKLSVEKLLRDMQTPSYRAGAATVGESAESLAAAAIVGMFTKPIAAMTTAPRGGNYEAAKAATNPDAAINFRALSDRDLYLLREYGNTFGITCDAGAEIRRRRELAAEGGGDR